MSKKEVGNVKIAGRTEAIVEVPMVTEIPAGVHVSKSMKRDDFTLAQAQVLKKVTLAIQDSNDYKLRNGRQIHSGPDALAWILEQIGGFGIR